MASSSALAGGIPALGAARAARGADRWPWRATDLTQPGAEPGACPCSDVRGRPGTWARSLLGWPVGPAARTAKRTIASRL